LRLSDVEQYGLTGEDCGFSGRFASDSIATEEEQDFLASGRRVELNEFTSPQFIEWLEAKLTQSLPHRLIPSDDILEDAYRRALAVASLNRTIERVSDRVIEKAKAASIPKSLRRKLARRLSASSAAWDEVLYHMVMERKSKRRPDGAAAD
jgi:hypothetical protein